MGCQRLNEVKKPEGTCAGQGSNRRLGTYKVTNQIDQYMRDTGTEDCHCWKRVLAIKKGIK